MQRPGTLPGHVTLTEGGGTPLTLPLHMPRHVARVLHLHAARVKVSSYVGPALRTNPNPNPHMWGQLSGMIGVGGEVGLHGGHGIMDAGLTRRAG